MQMTKKQLNNFWNKVEKTDSCWNWTASTINGYGRFNIGGDAYLTHRISLFIDGADIEIRKKEKGAKGSIVMHSCDNRLCVNPSHLEISTQKENVRDSIKKYTHFFPDWSGDNNPHSRFMRNNSCATA